MNVYIHSFYQVSQQVWNKLRNVCERSELRLQKRPNKKGEITTFLSGQNSKFTFLSGQNSNSPPFYWVKIQNLPLFIGSIFCKRSSLRSQTFLSFRTLHLAYTKLVGTPCTREIYFVRRNVRILYFADTMIGWNPNYAFVEKLRKSGFSTAHVPDAPAPMI